MAGIEPQKSGHFLSFCELFTGHEGQYQAG
ncbi:Uncharacterised protein [Shigella sonnei]|nr:Uncharacterised protein [Shigella sonnei]